MQTPESDKGIMKAKLKLKAGLFINFVLVWRHLLSISNPSAGQQKSVKSLDFFVLRFRLRFLVDLLVDVFWCESVQANDLIFLIGIFGLEFPVHERQSNNDNNQQNYDDRQDQNDFEAFFSFDVSFVEASLNRVRGNASIIFIIPLPVIWFCREKDSKILRISIPWFHIRMHAGISKERQWFQLGQVLECFRTNRDNFVFTQVKFYQILIFWK